MPKRAAPSEAAPAVSKKVKPAAAKAKASPKATRSTRSATAAAAAKSKLAEAESVAETAVEKVGAAVKTVKKAASKAKAKVDEVLENAGELLIDEVAPEPAAGARGQKALAKGKKAATKAKAKVDEVIDNAGDLLVDDVADKPASKGKKRKTAEDFIDTDAAAPAAPAPAAKKAAPAKKSKKAAKEPSPEPVAAPANNDEDDEMVGFETESEDGGADSSDDDSDAEDVAVREAGKKIDVNKLVKPSKDDKSVAKRLAKAQKKKGVERGTLYLGRIPHGFYEDEMREYFGQFGDVTRLRLARNPKSGASRHYAYIEFSSLPVAEVVAETMHNYLLMGHILKCNIIPQDDIHPELWVGANKKFRKVPRARLEKVRQDKVSTFMGSNEFEGERRVCELTSQPRTKEQQAKADEKVLKRQEERRQKIKAAGIDYEFEGH